jgi:hypothetical protein
VPEPGPVGVAADCEPTVGGEHHVRLARDGLDDVDAMPEGKVGVAQDVPLRGCTLGVDRDRRVHPRVDRVDDREVARDAHHVVAGARSALGGGPRGRGRGEPCAGVDDRQ